MSEGDRPRLFPVPERIRPFEVYRMPVRFEEDASKTRNHYVAVVVVRADGNHGTAVKLTSNPTWSGPADLPLLDWSQAGLTHVTLARCAQLIEFQREELQGMTGTLSVDDARRIVATMQSLPPEVFVRL